MWPGLTTARTVSQRATLSGHAASITTGLTTARTVSQRATLSGHAASITTSMHVARLDDSSHGVTEGHTVRTCRKYYKATTKINDLLRAELRGGVSLVVRSLKSNPYLDGVGYRGERSEHPHASSGHHRCFDVSVRLNLHDKRELIAGVQRAPHAR
jgi:hypothetical protein